MFFVTKKRQYLK